MHEEYQRRPVVYHADAKWKKRAIRYLIGGPESRNTMRLSHCMQKGMHPLRTWKFGCGTILFLQSN